MVLKKSSVFKWYNKFTWLGRCERLDVRKLNGQIKILRFEFLEQGQTVNQHCYLEILARLCKAVHRRRPELWPDAWNLHHDNTLAHDTLAVQEFLAKKIDSEIGPSTILTRFGPMRLLAIPKTEDRFKGPQIFRHCRHSGTCDNHPAEHSRRGVPEMF
jgi:hypothetical protein